MKSKFLKIGRADDNDIVYKHDSVSRYHLEVFIDDNNNVFITDLNSKNGTFINGNRLLGSTMLNPGDILKLGIDKPVQWNRWIANTRENSATQNEPVGQHHNPYSAPAPNKKKKNSFNVFFIVLIPLVIALVSFFAYSIIKSNWNKKDTDKDNGKVDSVSTVPQHDTSTKIAPDTASSVKYPNQITYDYGCMNDVNDNNQTEIINLGSDINEEILDYWGEEVDVPKEVEYGQKLHEQVKSDYDFISSGNAYQMLQNILFNLTRSIPSPRGFNYKIYLIVSDELNAFTAGGRIYVTTRMYNFCKSFDELACVIGHEIYHNELGHIRNGIKQASLPGGNIYQLITISFNQKNETECDLHGIDLAINAGYDGCACVQLWKRMKREQDSGDYDAVEALFRSHPYSSKREYCARNHILGNYGKNCQ